MAKITMNGDMISVPDNPTIPFIEGDGVGPEVTRAMRAVLDAAVDKNYGGGRRIEWMEQLAGGKAFERCGNWLPDETLESFRDYLVGIKGPLMTPVGEGIRSLNVAMRQTLDLYVCLRPVRWFPGVASPLKEPEKVDMVIFRENTEDIYAGIEWQAGSPEAEKFYRFLSGEMGVTKVRFPESSSFGVKPVSREGTRRLVRAAIEYAVKNGLPTVTLVHKGNIMKYTEGGFRNWGYDLAEQDFAAQTYTVRTYEKTVKEAGREAAEDELMQARAQGKVIVNDAIADAFLQNTLLTPEKYSVIATLNLNGDYISDQLAAMVGGIGIAPGANINYTTGHAVFEATHGTAPDIAGKNIVNPCSIILSAVMMLEYLGWREAAAAVTSAIEASFRRGRATGDLARFMPGGQALSTGEFTRQLINAI
ncbi:MAG: NADP-dependent isocitrate dehydrogenase [Rikenellaceae bacterium]|nr:NADP-dependent isocitrate dehydrogenase [Rikenellaceae bacterium]